MLPKLPFMLEKLRIEVFSDRKRGFGGRLKRLVGLDDQSMEVMFNPESYGSSQAIVYQKPQGISMPAKPARYSLTEPEELSFKLVLDGTGVAYVGVEALGRALAGQSVAQQIEKFRRLCLRMNGAIHEPNFLTVSWGSLSFNGRLKSLDIKYTLLGRSGDPLRAELDVVFVKDATLEAIAREAGKSSPDLTHIRVVKRGDTLPLLAREIYGSASHYLFVAEANGLDDFRNLTPGQELSFPPLPPRGDTP